MNGTQAMPLVFLGDDHSATLVAEYASVGGWVTTDRNVALRAQKLLVYARASDLARVAKTVSETSRVHRLYGLLVREDVDASWLPHMMYAAGLHTLKRTHAYTGTSVPRRVMRAIAMDSAHESIADATVAGDCLLVLSCAFAWLRVPFAAVRALATMPLAYRGAFTIADDGAYLYWPSDDVHLGLDALLCAVHPERQLAADLERLAESAALGPAVRSVREAQSLTQAGIEGLSARQLRRIERGEGGASLSERTLCTLAAAHGMSADSYLQELTATMNT